MKKLRLQEEVYREKTRTGGERDEPSKGGLALYSFTISAIRSPW